MSKDATNDRAALVCRLDGKRGRALWRSLGERSRDPKVTALLQREFPGLPSLAEATPGRRRRKRR